MSRNQLLIDKVYLPHWITGDLSVRELSEELEILFGSVQFILSANLGMKLVSVKFVPKLLTVKQKEARLAIATDFLQYAY